jgi:hypothetical protein
MKSYCEVVTLDIGIFPLLLLCNAHILFEKNSECKYKSRISVTPSLPITGPSNQAQRSKINECTLPGYGAVGEDSKR